MNIERETRTDLVARLLRADGGVEVCLDDVLHIRVQRLKKSVAIQEPTIRNRQDRIGFASTVIASEASESWNTPCRSKLPYVNERLVGPSI